MERNDGVRNDERKEKAPTPEAQKPEAQKGKNDGRRGLTPSRLRRELEVDEVHEESVAVMGNISFATAAKIWPDRFKENGVSTTDAKEVPSEPFQLAESSVEKAKNDPERVVARYIKQEWRGDYARRVGVEYWDVTSVIDSMSRERVLKMKDYDFSTDKIVHDYSAHEGPHEVVVVEQAHQYLGITDEEVDAFFGTTGERG